MQMQIDFHKYADGLVPAIVQDFQTGVVLMLGFMNQESLDQTRALQKVTFYSRSKQRLWTKGEESGHFLLLKEILADCDADTLLIKAEPAGPVCHTGADTCFNERNRKPEGSDAALLTDPEPAGAPDTDLSFIRELESVIDDRYHNRQGTSYTASLFNKGINKVAQKVGEEAVEVVIEAKDNDPDKFLGESADLLYHFLILLRAKDQSLKQVVSVLRDRHR